MNPLRWHHCPECGRYDTDRALDSDGLLPLQCSDDESAMERVPDPVAALEAEVARLHAGGCARDQRTTQHCALAEDALRQRDELLEQNGQACVRAEEAEDRAEKAERALADAKSKR